MVTDEQIRVEFPQFQGKVEHLRSLLEGVEAWNACLSRNRYDSPDLQGVNLAMRDLPPEGELEPLWERGGHFEAFANLRKAHLMGARLNGAHLEGANLSEANLEGADLVGAHLEGANLSEANLSGAKLETANLEGANLSGARLEGANLSEANLEGAHLSGAHLEGANLSETNLEGAHLSGAHLEGADLSETYLEGANLERANLDGVNLKRTNLKGANLERANLQAADLRQADLKGADLKRARLEGANLSEANLEGANLEGANLQAALLGQAILKGANLKLAKLQGAQLAQADLAYARLWGAKLHRANLAKAKLEALDFHDVAGPHPALFDGSDTVRLRRFDKLINWKRIRSLGQLPLFGVSWSLLAGILVLINTIGYLNQVQVNGKRIIDWLQYPIPIPRQLAEILVVSVILAIGSTFYRAFCPSTVQEFSESAWVDKGNPRLLYIAQALERPVLRFLTGIFLVSGAVGSLWILGLRVVQAFWYIVTVGF